MATTHDLRFDVEGLHCAACVGRLETALRSASPAEVAEVSVSLTSHRVRVAVVGAAESARDGVLVMSLVRAAAEAGYALVDPSTGGVSAREAIERRVARIRTALAALLTIPLVVTEMGGPPLPGAPWTQGVLAALVVFGCGAEILLRGVRAALRRSPDMHTLVALGAAAAMIASVVGILHPESARIPGAHGDHMGTDAPRWFESAAVVIAFVLLGRLLEARARGRAGDALRALAGMRPLVAHRRTGEPGAAIEDVAGDVLAVGDVVVVRPGERVPVDGTVVDGASSVEASLLTGEPMPVPALAGAEIPGGALNLEGVFALRATAVGAATRLMAIQRAVEESASTKAPVARQADLIAARFVPAVLVFALLTAVFWAIFGPEPRLAFVFATATAVLVVACPCALGLATPVAVAVGMGRGAARGVFVRHAAALEALARADVLICDKTGTVTRGVPEAVDVRIRPDLDAKSFWSAVATAESDSTHPIGRALARRARKEGGVAGPRTEFREIPGSGVTCLAAGVRIDVGRGTSGAVSVVIDDVAAGEIDLRDPPRAEAREVIAALMADGLKVILATGDAEGPAREAAAMVGITDVRAGLSPEDKRMLVRAEKVAGRTVAVLGDGVNDAPALAEADVGRAFGGADLAAAAAGVALAGGDLQQVLAARRLARNVLKTVRQNLAFAFAYNLVMLPAAAGLLYPLTGRLLDPMWAGAAMALSSVTVVLNSLRVR